MPSTSAKQHNFMAAIAHSPSFAKKVGVSQSVGKDFAAADKGKTFATGGVTKQKINKQKNKIKLFFEKDKKLRIKVTPKADKTIKKKNVHKLS